MKIMAVDFGDSRTGLAVCDKGEILASPCKTITEKSFDRCAEQVAAAFKEFGAEMAVVGLPINMNGTKGPRAQLCEEFAARLRELTDIEIVMWDERSTTVSAAQMLNDTNKRGKKRKAIIDAAAAAIILQSYLDFRKNASAAQ